MRGFWGAAFLLLILVITQAASAVTFAASSNIRIAVPIDDNSPETWESAIHGYPAVGMIILNPSSGPGTSPDPSLEPFVRDAQQKGVRVVGYVPTSYASGAQSIQQAEAAVDSYLSWYHADGIFFDEVNSSCASQPAEYYAALHDYVKSKGQGILVVLNPGTDPGACYASEGDVMLNFEDSMNAYLRDYVPPPWTPSNPGSLLYHVVFGANDLEAMQLLILKAAERNAAWVYVTNLDASNGTPYQRLPSYFSQEVDFVNSIDGMHAPLARWEAAFLIITPLVVLVILSVDMIERRKK